MKGLSGFNICRRMSSFNISLKSSSPFKVLDGSLDRKSSDFLEAADRNEILSGHFQTFFKKMKAGGGQRSIKRHIEVNKKILPWNRVTELLDDETEFLDICNFAGFGMDYGDIPSAGYILGIGKVFNRYCLICANDSTVKSGAAYPITVSKHLRAQEIGMQNRLPCIYVVDSAGAFLPLQSEVFPDKNHGGRVFYNEAVMSADRIPQISVVCGSCTAGGAYVPTMSEEAVIVKKIGTIFLGGPPLVKAATGEIVSEEELGGADLHCRTSGCTDYMAQTEREAYQTCRDIVATLGIPENTTQDSYEEPLYSDDDLNTLGAFKSIKKENVYQILARLMDGSRFHEFKSEYGSSLIAGFGLIEGQLVGVVCNIGSLSSQDSQNGAHFVLMCNQRRIPLIFLQNSAPYHSYENHWKNCLEPTVIKDRAKLISVVATAQVPKITINIGGCFGDDNFTMCGRSFNPNFLFTWPGAETSMTWNDANKEIDLQENPLQRSSSSFFSTSRVLNDGIILPKDTRKTLSACLKIVQSGFSNQESQLPIIRM